MMRRIRLCLLILFTAAAGLGPALASPLPIGSIVGSTDAILDGQQALPDTAVLSGDSLQVNDGLAMVALGQGSRMILGHDTEASFLQEPDAVTVSLSRGNMSLYHSATSRDFRVKIGDVTVSPAQGYKTLGEVAMADGLLLVTAKGGALQIEKAGTTQVVSAGKTITLPMAPDRSPTPNPSGNRHLKHIIHLSPAVLLYLGLAAEAGGAATAIVLGTRSSAPASPVTP